MPQSWSKEDAKVWSEMSPEQRAIVGRREAERDKFVRGKAFEATQVKQQVENQARDLIAKMHDDHALSLQVYAQQFQAQQPDQRLRYNNDQIGRAPVCTPVTHAQLVCRLLLETNKK